MVHSFDGIADIYSLARIAQQAEKSLLSVLNVVSGPGSEPQSTDQLLRQLTPYVLSCPLQLSRLNWHRYRLRCQDLIFQDFALSTEKNVEPRLWEVHTKINNHFRKQFGLVSAYRYPCCFSRLSDI